MNLAAKQHISTRDFAKNFSTIKKENKLTIVMDGARPTSIVLPYNEGFLDLLQSFVKKNPSQLKAEKALAEYKTGKTKNLDQLATKYGIKLG
jgi:hypothetical protein